MLPTACRANAAGCTLDWPPHCSQAAFERKNILLITEYSELGSKLSYMLPVPPHQRGVSHRQQRGAGCGGRGCAFDEGA